MVDLKKLKVSLTKHGAHKVYKIMMQVSPDVVLNHIDDISLNVHIDEAQTRQNMSIRPNNVIPIYWALAKERGEQHLKLMVLFAICHSHYLIIEALKYSKPRFGRGVILRGRILDGKAYTNLANNFEELDFSAHSNEQGFEYDFSEAFSLDGFNELFIQMLKDKLIQCGMSESKDKQSIIETAIELNLHLILGLTENEYRSWLLAGIPEFDADNDEPLLDDIEIEKKDLLSFRPGHIERSTLSLKIHAKAGAIEISQLHNHIQNKLVRYLENLHGTCYVGSEQSIGEANRVDVVVKKKNFTYFYEIKTAKLARIAIRQALPQLMEYAFRPNVQRADELIIVAPSKPTDSDITYISCLRNRFGISIYYMQYNINDDIFVLFGKNDT